MGIPRGGELWADIAAARALLTELAGGLPVTELVRHRADAEPAAAVLADALTSTRDQYVAEAIPLIRQGINALADVLVRLTTAAEHLNACANAVQVRMAALGEVLARVRTALDLLGPGELAAVAEQLRGEVLPLPGQLAQESRRPELAEAHAVLAGAPEELDRVAELFREAASHGENYVERRGGAGSATVVTPPTTATTAPPPPASGPLVDPALIAEVQRAGLEIPPGRVVRIGRDSTGRIVWVEEGDQDAGAQHLRRKERVEEFAEVGTPEDEVLGVVRRAAAVGGPVATLGKSGVVVEVGPTEGKQS